MPRPVAVTAAQISRAAFELVRREGREALTARRVADELGVSTQPVYSAWGSMEALHDQVARQVQRFVRDFLAVPEPDAPAALSVGIRILRLAEAEPRLFALAASWMREQLATPEGGPLAAAARDPRLGGLPEATRRQAGELLWVLTLGLAAVLDTGTGGLPLERACELLVVGGEAVIAAAVQGRGPR